MKPIIILENIRSAYNVGNIIRTADALGYEVILSGFSPSPTENESVKKTSLGAEEHVNLQQYWHVQESLDYVKKKGYTLIAVEIVPDKSIALDSLTLNPSPDGVEIDGRGEQFGLIVGNENTGVMQATLDQTDHIVHIPMQGIKESINVGQAAAIAMWEMQRLRVNMNESVFF